MASTLRCSSSWSEGRRDMALSVLEQVPLPLTSHKIGICPEVPISHLWNASLSRRTERGWLNLGWIDDPPVPSPDGLPVSLLVRAGAHNRAFGIVIAADAHVVGLIRSPDVEATGQAGGSAADGAWQGVKLDHRISASLAWRSPYRRSAPLSRTPRG